MANSKLCSSETGVCDTRGLLCSMRCHLCCCHGAAQVIRELKQMYIIQVRRSGLAEWKGAGRNGKGEVNHKKESRVLGESKKPLGELLGNSLK